MPQSLRVFQPSCGRHLAASHQKVIKTVHYNDGETWYDLGSGQWISGLYVSVK
ncbi:hypothetical protein [Lactobacillus selangorensis]|uniref:hypothetical protein n=1 Tax=Lactobacillus selangorensis TaxID=81857 RepID=UPI0012E33812|nr:hypothetical protein [Lactobacillus selangorensis]